MSVFDNFRVSVPVADAALFSGRQAQIRSDSYIRQDSAGAVWGAKTVDGDYLYLPAAGREGRSCQLLLRFSRGTPDSMTDAGGAADQVSGTVYYTPRYRNVPT